MLEKVILVSTQKKTHSEVPVTVLWNNARMVRIHSVRAATREILNLSKALDVVKVNIIGTPSTGKTTLAKTLAHLCHRMSDIPYTIKIYNREDLVNFEETLSKLEPTNHVLIFDDISFMTATVGKRQIDKIQKAFTEIRHLPGGQDVKIIAIFNFHYNMAVSKYMRQSDFFIYTSVGSSELENTVNIVGKKYHAKILDFRRINQTALTTGKFTFNLGKKGQKFIYEWRKPYAPVLFWNNDSLRVIVFPEREWIDPICSQCVNMQSNKSEIKMITDLTEFDKESKRFGTNVLKQALKIKLFSMGVPTYSKHVKQAMQWLDEQLNSKHYDIAQIAEFYGLEDKRTRLDKV